MLRTAAKSLFSQTQRAVLPTATAASRTFSASATIPSVEEYLKVPYRTPEQNAEIKSIMSKLDDTYGEFSREKMFAFFDEKLPHPDDKADIAKFKSSLQEIDAYVAQIDSDYKNTPVPDWKEFRDSMSHYPELVDIFQARYEDFEKHILPFENPDYYPFIKLMESKIEEAKSKQAGLDAELEKLKKDEEKIIAFKGKLLEATVDDWYDFMGELDGKDYKKIVQDKVRAGQWWTADN